MCGWAHPPAVVDPLLSAGKHPPAVARSCHARRTQPQVSANAHAVRRGGLLLAWRWHSAHTSPPAFSMAVAPRTVCTDQPDQASLVQRPVHYPGGHHFCPCPPCSHECGRVGAVAQGLQQRGGAWACSVADMDAGIIDKDGHRTVEHDQLCVQFLTRMQHSHARCLRRILDLSQAVPNQPSRSEYFEAEGPQSAPFLTALRF